MTDQYEAPLVPDEPETIDPEAIGAEARASFSLADRLRGINHRETKVVVFTDVQAVDRYSQLNEQAQALSDLIGRIGLADKIKAAEAEPDPIKNARLRIEVDIAQSKLGDLSSRFEKAEAAAEEARAEMLAGALSIHMRAFPNIAAKVARRKAIRKFTDPTTKQIPQERSGEFQDYIDSLLFGDSVRKIVNAQGNEEDLGPREGLFELLSDTLPISQWERVYEAYTLLMFTDKIAQDATADPGF